MDKTNGVFVFYHGSSRTPWTPSYMGLRAHIVEFGFYKNYGQSSILFPFLGTMVA
jgi:hypothetical protein